MKRISFLLILIAGLFSNPVFALKTDFYKNRSLLSQGKWVKVGVDRTGLYEISYDALRSMGFSNPEQVSVFGRGGTMLAENFTNNGGTPLLTDDIEPVKVLHQNGKLYFYGLGPEDIQFVNDSKYETGGYFQRLSRNIYTNRGYYFLSDSSSPVNMETSNVSASSTNVNKGVSYCYHEKDSIQNTTKSGQLFWGEFLGLPFSNHRNWEVSMPDAIAGNGVMECAIYVSGVDASKGGATVSYGFEDSKYFSTPFKETSKTTYSVHTPTVAAVEIPGTSGKVFAEFNYVDSADEFSYLDYWVVSYNRNIPTLRGTNGEYLDQQMLALPDIAKNSSANIVLKDCASFTVVDVTDPKNPRIVPVQRNGSEGTITVSNEGVTPQLVIFDNQRPQYQISGFESAYSMVENQNLHSYKDTGGDFVIITDPKYLAFSEELADLHRLHDGIDVIVATTDQCYNEFSAGVPDAMAYRSFAKMLYMSPKAPKNILLVGTLYADNRGLLREKNPFDGIIAYQTKEVSTSRGAHNVNDFYGMMDDIVNLQNYEKNPVQIGVAIMPLRFESEAKIMLDKIRDYLERTDFAYYLNKLTVIGGLYDEHTHERQVYDLDVKMRELSQYANIFSPIPIDSYGCEEAQKKLFNQVNDGTMIMGYFGHAGPSFMGSDKFFNTGEVYRFRNKFLPFAFFAGCEVTNSDTGLRGIGEAIITTTPYGCIGGLVSMRETWSGQNFEFINQFFNSLFLVNPNDKTNRNVPAKTIGEVYATAKSISTYNNELAYQLLCDPALVIPSVNGDVGITSLKSRPYPGEFMQIEGSIKNAKGDIDKTFNGDVVVRLMEPTQNVPAGNIETGEDAGKLTFAYRDVQISMGSAKVENGVFSVELYIPGSASTFVGKDCNLFFAAYNPETKTGAGRGWTITLEKGPSSETTESKDNIPPVIENFAFEETSSTFDITVSDNLALNLANDPLLKGFYFYVDGKERSEGFYTIPILETGRQAYSKKITIPGLTYGEHTATLKVKDAAGNTTIQEITFSYTPLKPQYVIALSDKSNSEKSVITCEGQAPAEAQLRILAPSGLEVWKGSFKSGETEWDHTDMSGRKVAPGHYKGYIIETGNAAHKGHSATIDIPVI